MLKRNTGPGHILVFDVNETLLDVNALRPQFERIFKDAGVLKQWFAQMLLYSQTLTQTGEYADFGKVGRAALEMMEAVAVARSLVPIPVHHKRGISNERVS
jgi:2-haloacid dehalogenase